MEVWKNLEGKKVYIILKNQRQYSGIVLNIEIATPLIWITINDKYNKQITFSRDEIELIEEEE